ncbi:MAG: maleylacetate reductase [Burkholderiales bacterium]
MKAFTYNALPSRVVFGPGRITEVGAELEKIGSRRALVITTPGRRALADQVAGLIGAACAGVCDMAVMHTPLETAIRARKLAQDAGADALVSAGGGSTVGLAKAIALTNDLPILAIPTTYSGSEMTPVQGITENGVKVQRRDARMLPRAVIYDPQLLRGLPSGVAGPSGMNGIAHAVEAMYAREANPITSDMAEESIRRMSVALPSVIHEPGNVDAIGEALYGACLAGICLASVGMAIHHKLCHTLGGSFNLPHAQTHTIMLPHAVRYNQGAAPDAMARIARALHVTDAAECLFDLARALGAPAALRDIGMPADGLERAADLAVKDPYWNPRPIERTAVRQLLQDAWEGKRPV